MYTPANDRYNNMTYNKCGKSGLKLPPISLGLWHNFGDVDDFDTAREMIHVAFDNGITHFDLANNYGPPPGSAEFNFGKILHRDLADHRHEIIISTKAGHPMWPGPYGDGGSKKYLLTSLDQSLERMGLDYVDIFYSHRPDPETPLEETMEALATAVAQGKALYAGISKYPADITARAAGLMTLQSQHLLIHQPKYSMLHRKPETEGLFHMLDRLGVGCICFCPLAQGLLTDKYIEGIPDSSRAAKKHGFLRQEDVTYPLREKITELSKIAQRRGQSLAQMSIAWVLRHQAVTSALIGASRPAQIRENLKTLDNLHFDDQELIDIDTALSL
jgi:L-glyceraldehyde 3-phosphate reductase